MKDISVRVFIATYKNVPYLSKVLESLCYQTFKNFSVSILEDGNNHALRAFLLDQMYPYQVEHFDQEDKGFRKNRILNIGIKNAHEELIIFLDEDCIFHPSFINEYVKHFEKNTVCFGKRVNLDKITTKKIMESEVFKIPSLFSLYKNKSTHVENGIFLPFFKPKETDKPTLLGCNMAIPMNLLKKINGFDEDYTSAGYGGLRKQLFFNILRNLVLLITQWPVLAEVRTRTMTCNKGRARRRLADGRSWSRSSRTPQHAVPLAARYIQYRYSYL